MKKTLRIGIDAKRAFNNSSGLGNYSRWLIRGLQQHAPKHAYFLFTPGIDPRFASFADGHDRTQVIVPGGAWKAFPSLWRSVNVTAECKALDLDVYHGLSNELPFNISSFAGLKLVTIHDLIFLRYPSYYGTFDRHVYNLKVKAACKSADLVIAPSTQTAEDLATFLDTPPHKILVIGQDCDAGFGIDYTKEQVRSFADARRLPAKFILSVGTPEKRKDQLTIMAVLAEPGMQDLALVLAGKNTAYARELLDHAAARGLGGRVTLLSDVSNEEMPLLYRNASAFVYASEFEGFGIPLLEAMRSAVPVISASSSSLTEVAGEAALYFKPHDHVELASKLRVILSDETERHKRVEAGRKQAALFDTAALIGRLQEAYRSGN